MEIDEGFVTRVRELAENRRWDWRFHHHPDNFRANRDAWLSAQLHVRGMGYDNGNLVPPRIFIEHVRSRAEERYRNNRGKGSSRDGANQDFDKSLVDCLVWGKHSKEQKSWHSRGGQENLATVYFYQAEPTITNFHPQLRTKLDGLTEFPVHEVVFLNDLQSARTLLSEANRMSPKVICIFVGKQRDEPVREFLDHLHSNRVPWRADMRFIHQWARVFGDKLWANEIQTHDISTMALYLAQDLAAQ